ncbi:MAG TPA: glycoside hydrolase 43 family protein, partial [Polyangiaceae bacterium]
MRLVFDRPTTRFVFDVPALRRKPDGLGTSAILLLALACSGSNVPGTSTAAGGSTTNSGGSSSVSSAPGAWTGGGGSGGSAASGSGAATVGANYGGVPAITSDVGGSTAAIGSRSSGGAAPAGGSTASNSGLKTGGTNSNGGSTASGATAAFGATSAALGGAKASGGAPSTGGTRSSGGGASNGGASSMGGSTTTGTGGTNATCPSTYSNPVLWEDLPDVDVIRVDDTYYYSASSFHYSPGAPLLRSYDLVNWEYIGHSVPVLDFDPSYNLSGSRSYVNGIWASSLRYRKSNNTYYWIGCMHNVGGGYVFTATSPEGPWTKHTAQGCYYDVGLLIDDDDTMYVAYGNTTINVAQLSKDGFTQVKTQKVLDSPSDIGALEGSRFYKIKNDYYIFTTQYANGEYVLRS